MEMCYNMLKTSLQPGKEYRLNELADLIGKTRTTIDRYVERFNIKMTTIIHLGKQVQAAVLTEENIRQILELNPDVETLGDNVGDHLFKPSVATLLKQDDNLLQQVESLREKLHLTELERAVMQEKLIGVERELRRADEQIETLKQSNLTLDQALKTSFLLEGRRQEFQTVNLIPETQSRSQASFPALRRLSASLKWNFLQLCCLYPNYTDP